MDDSLYGNLSHLSDDQLVLKVDALYERLGWVQIHGSSGYMGGLLLHLEAVETELRNRNAMRLSQAYDAALPDVIETDPQSTTNKNKEIIPTETKPSERVNRPRNRKSDRPIHTISLNEDLND